jgi:hypothetical protein
MRVATKIPLLALCLACLLSAIARAEEFVLDFSAPTSVAGMPGAVVRYDAVARLSSAVLAPAAGASGWSIAIVAAGGAIVDADTAGTAAASSEDDPPGFRQGGFVHTELTTGPGNEGVTSAVALSFESDVTLPAGGDADLLRLVVEARVPMTGCALVTLLYEDGLQASGAPIRNLVSRGAIEATPARRAGSTLVCATVAPVLELDFNGPRTVEGEAGSSVVFAAAARLRSADLPTDEGVAAWSVALRASGSGSEAVSIRSATTAGTAGALASNGPPGLRLASGFELTELTSGPGNQGVVSVVALDFLTPLTLPATGTFDILRLEVEAVAPAEKGCSDVTLAFADGLRGSGLPVLNRLSYAGLSVRPGKNAAVTEVCLRSAGGGQVPGDCNQDGDVDISDIICLAKYLFEGRPPVLPCDEGADDPGSGDVLLADWNRDLNIDLSDVVRSASYLFQGGAEHPLGRTCVRIEGCPETCME